MRVDNSRSRSRDFKQGNATAKEITRVRFLSLILFIVFIRYRLAPGNLREFYKESPLFGVHLALKSHGRIRVGDTVYARYKPSPF